MRSLRLVPGNEKIGWPALAASIAGILGFPFWRVASLNAHNETLLRACDAHALALLSSCGGSQYPAFVAYFEREPLGFRVFGLHLTRSLVGSAFASVFAAIVSSVLYQIRWGSVVGSSS